jgi:hypothetical protein
MSEFRINEEQYRKFRRKFLAVYFPIFAGALLWIVVMETYTKQSSGFPAWAAAILIFMAYIGFTLFRLLRRQRQILMSYSVTISSDGITREQANTPTISISFMEIKEIIKTKKGGFLIKGLHRTDLIAIPRWLNENGQLEQELQKLAPITTDKRDPLMIRYRSLLVLLAVGMYICLYTFQNKVVIAASALVLVGLLGWSFYEIQISKNVTTYRKRSSWLYLLIIASIIYMTYIKLTLWTTS